MVFTVGTANATLNYCTPGITSLLASVGAVGSGTVQCGSVTFSNFTITDAGNSPSAFLTYVVGTPLGNITQGSYYDTGTGSIYLVLNPNLNNNLVAQDVHITFDVQNARGPI